MDTELRDETTDDRAQEKLSEADRKAVEQLNSMLPADAFECGPCQAVLDRLPSPVFVKDVRGAYLACNTAFEKFVGLSRGELLGRTVWDLFPEELASVYARKDQELIESGERKIYKGQVQYADGTLREVIFNKTAFAGSDGRCGGIVGVVVDNTPLRESERKLEEWLSLNAERLRQLECLHGLSQLITRRLPPDRFLPGVAWVIHSSREPRGCVGVRLLLDRDEYHSPGFEVGPVRLTEGYELDNAHHLEIELHYDAGDDAHASALLAEDERRLARSAVVQAGAYLERYLAEESLRRHLALESAASRISARFASTSDLDQALEEALGEVAREVGASRANLHAYEPGTARVAKVVEWCGPGVPSVKDNLASLDLFDFPWWGAKLRAGQIIRIRSSDDLPDSAQAERRAMEGLGSGSVMAVPILHDGQLHGFAGFSTVSHLVSWDEADTAILTVFAELASRTIVREQRAKSIVQLATAVQQSRDGIIIADLNGVIEYVNPAIERMTGYATAELLGRELKEFVPTDDDRNSHPSLWPSVRQGLPWHGQLALTRRDGTGYHEDCKISPIRNSDGELTAFLAIKRDITDRVQLEAQLRQAQKLESIGQLAAGIAHEINTPTQYVGDNTRFLQEAFGELGELASELASLVAPGAAGDALGPENLERLRGRLQEADAEFLLEEVPSAISQSLEGIERIRSIVLAMREFAHPGSNKKEPTDVNDGVRNTVTISRNVWKYDCELTLQLDPDMPLVPCDVAEINQAILNLITNAAYAIKESREAAGTEDLGVLTIATRSIGEWAEILISDTGTGIPAGIRERIFDPFFTTKEVGLGTGQGLAIVRNLIVDKHGGEIDLESQEGQGTTFRIRLPLS